MSRLGKVISGGAVISDRRDAKSGAPSLEIDKFKPSSISCRAKVAPILLAGTLDGKPVMVRYDGPTQDGLDPSKPRSPATVQVSRSATDDYPNGERLTPSQINDLIRVVREYQQTSPEDADLCGDLLAGLQAM